MKQPKCWILIVLNHKSKFSKARNCVADSFFTKYVINEYKRLAILEI